MDADSSTGLNENSESGECDSPSPDENTSNTVDFDSASKLSAASERTNIDALDDTARDTLIVPPAEDSSHSAKSAKHNSARVDISGDHDVLDFEGDDLEDNNVRGKGLNNDGEDDEDEEGELEDEKDTPGSASPQPGLEEGECVEDRPAPKPARKQIVYQEAERDEGEDDELEEGEVTDDEDRNNKDPKPVCRFFGKGQCTWGSNCRFLHPGVTDKGLYTMFDPMRPLLPIPNNPASATVKPGLLGIAPPNFPPIVKPEEPVIESAWERGLRNAKEIIKQSVKRKETDIDFEEKKMNLTLAQEEIDKENDYYVRKPASPEPVAEPTDEDPYVENYETPGPWTGPTALPPPNLRHTVVTPQKIDPDFVRERVHRLHKPGRAIREAPPRDAPIREAPPLHEPEVRMVRESALRRGHNFQDQYSGSHGSRRNYDDPRKAEEWHDPWMRTKSPGDRVSRKDSTVSKRSSYSSGSSRSSSRSSSSSKSSRSSRSSSKSSKSSRGSNSPATKKRRKSRDEVVRKAPPRRMSPKPVRIAPPPPPKEEFSRRPQGGYGGGPLHYDRPPRFAPSPPKMPGHLKDRLPDKSNPSQSLVRERDLKGGRGGNRMRHRSNWSRTDSTSKSRSRSVSRSRSRSPWSKSLSKSHSKSRSRSISSKPRTRSKFSRERSISRSPTRSRSLSRRLSSSRSRSPSSSSTSSSSLGSPTLTRTKRKAPSVEKTVPASVENPNPDVHIVSKPTHRKPDVGKVQATAPVKPQIKMTLKPTSGLKSYKNVIDRLSDDVKDDRGKDAGNRTPIPDDESSREAVSIEDVSNGGKGTSPKENKQSAKRREELLKQLKAVEDAIAKKRSKLELK